VRTISLILVMLAAGCSSPLFGGAASDPRIPEEAVRTYAKAHALSREEARRELSLYKDADYLRDLRQTQKQLQEQPAEPAPSGRPANDVSPSR
jgi:hypothetical protein